MPKRRRKLSSELEKTIFLAKKRVEFITAVINDIDDEEIQGEYRIAFDSIKMACQSLNNEYTNNGVTEDSEYWLSKYTTLLNQFETDYEI